MYCKNCGEFVPDGAIFCINCKTQVIESKSDAQHCLENSGLPKCEKCGHIGMGVPEKFLTKKDIIRLTVCLINPIGIILFPISFIFLYVKKKNPEARNIVCSKCGTELYKKSKKKKSVKEITDTAKNLATNPELKGALKDLKKSALDIRDTMYLD